MSHLQNGLLDERAVLLTRETYSKGKDIYEIQVYKCEGELSTLVLKLLEFETKVPIEKETLVDAGDYAPLVEHAKVYIETL